VILQRSGISIPLEYQDLARRFRADQDAIGHDFWFVLFYPVGERTSTRSDIRNFESPLLDTSDDGGDGDDK